MQPGITAANIPFWRRLQMKFAVSYLALIALVLVLLNTYPVLVSEQMVFKAKQTSMQSQAAVIASTISVLEELTVEDGAQVMEMLDDSGLTRGIITDLTGLILYDTEEDSASGSRYALIQELVRALNGYDVFVSTYKNGAFRSSAAVPVVYRNATIGGVYIYDYDSEQGDFIVALQQNLFRISLVMLGITTVLSALFSGTLTRRISRLTSGIGRLSEGSYSTRVKVSGKDELATLAKAFNTMTQRLEATDEVRRRFVSDAAHELKTPLASIKLLTDSIVQSEDMDEATMREFVMDIGSEADRLTRITEKLLALTRMDYSGQGERTWVDLNQVVSSALHMLRPLAERQSISIYLEPEEGCILRSSADELHQVVFNLVENAIKYNRPGGDIRVATRREENRVLLSVEDTGIGIPEEDLPRIFDRFYRVDKARSREAGGAGLGLSIVRDTVVSNGGSIRAERRAEGGTVFTVLLPLMEKTEEVQQT